MKKMLALASMAALLCASTAFAKKALDEEEMELVTAAGQPAVIIVESASGETITVNGDEMGLITQTVDTGSQTNLRALALNNVAGENQVANAINIRSGAASTASGSGQSNEINQSWGATFDWSFAPGTATSADGGDVDLSAGSIGDVKINCVAVGAGTACAASDVATAGDGSSSTEAAVPLSAYADKIIGVIGGDATGAIDVSQMNAATVTQSILENSQSNLAALAVNNVAGQNQLANAVNITSRGATFAGTNSNGDPLLVADSALTGGSSYGGNQSNVINQYRGTPLSRPCANCPLPVAP